MTAATDATRYSHARITIFCNSEWYDSPENNQLVGAQCAPATAQRDFR